MPFQGPGKGAQPRTLRSIATSQNSASNFDDGAAYDAQGGHPITAELPKGTYSDKADQAKLGSLGKPSEGDNKSARK